MNEKCIMIAKLKNHCNYDMANRVYWWGGLCPTIPTRYDENMTGFNIMTEENKVRLVGGVGQMKSNNNTQYYQQDRIYDSDEIALCQSANESFNPWYQVEEKPLSKHLTETLEQNDLTEEISFIDAYNRSIKTDGVSGTISTRTDASNDTYVSKNLRIRKLTPNECWRLMGFSDEDFKKAEKVNSNAQLYKQAGNSIVVNVLMAIFKEML